MRFRKAAPKAPPPRADFLHAAADRVAPLMHTAADRLGPLAVSAADRVGPLTTAARTRVVPLAAGAAGFVGPYASSAVGRVGPYASSVKQRGVQVAQGTVDRFGPPVVGAVGRVTPVVIAARGTLGDAVRPRLSGALGAAANTPVVLEAARRGRATLAAVRGELVLPVVVEEKPRSQWIKRAGIAAAVAGAAAVGVRKFLGSKDADWQAARPTASYPSTSTGSATAASGVQTPVGVDAAGQAEAAAAHDEDSALSKYDAGVAAPDTEAKRQGYSPSDPMTVLADETAVEEAAGEDHNRT